MLYFVIVELEGSLHCLKDERPLDITQLKWQTANLEY